MAYEQQIKAKLEAIEKCTYQISFWDGSSVSANSEAARRYAVDQAREWIAKREAARSMLEYYQFRKETYNSI